MRIVLVLLTCFVLTGPALADAEPSRPTVLVLGDSLSAGYGIDQKQSWVALLRQRMKDRGYPYRVVNASISGETTRGASSRIDRALEVHDPDIVVIELGGNDGLRGLPLDAMRRNLAGMIEKSRAAGANVLLVGMRLPPNYGPAYTERFHAVYKDLAETHKVPLVPFLLDGVATRLELMQDDGIHPRAVAQSQLLDNVWPKLEPLLNKRTLSIMMRPVVAHL